MRATTDREPFRSRGHGNARSRRAFSLTDCLVAAVILAVATFAVSAAIFAGHANTAYAVHVQCAVRLAEELLEYVLARPYDSLTSYNGYSEPAGQIKDIQGSLYPADYQVFHRSVVVQASTQTISGLGAVSGMMVTVTVQDAKGGSWGISRFVPQPPPS